MKKILFVASVYFGHLAPARALIKSLEASGNSVDCYIPEQFVSKVEDWDIKVQAYPRFDELEHLFAAHLITGDVHERLYQLVHNTVQATFKIAPWLIEKLAHEQYDLIIYDNMALWGHVSANEVNIPSICSTGVMPINQKTIAETGEGSVYINNLPARISQPLHELQSKYSSDVNSLLDLISGQYHERVLVFTSPTIQRHAHLFPKEQYIFYPHKYSIADVPATRPTFSDPAHLYCSLGTLFNHDQTLFETLVDAIAQLPVIATVSTGGEKKVYELLMSRPQYDNVKIVEYIDQKQALESTDIFLTHAGFNSAQESILCLVPMVILPIAGDQHFIAKTMVEHGVGHIIDRTANVAEQLEHYVQQILGNWQGYQEKLHLLRNSLIDQHAEKEAIHTILTYPDDLPHDEL